MKIALVFSSGFHPQLEYMETAIAREFKKLGHEIVIITKDRHHAYINYEETMQPLIGPQYVGVGKFYEENYLVYRLKTFFFGKNKRFQLNPGIFFLLLKLNPDLIFFQTVENAYGAIQATFAKILIRSKLYFVLNELPIFHNNLNQSRRAFKHRINDKIKIILEKISLGCSDRIITMNECCYERALQLSPKRENIIIPITLGVDISRVKFRPRFRNNFRQKLGLSENDILIITTGKILPNKKTDLLLQAIIKIKNPSIYLLIVGNGPKEFISQLKEMANGYEHKRNIFFYPSVPSNNLHYYFSASDLAIWADSATISTLEASAVGIPIIVPDFHGYEHRTKNNNGFKFQRGNIEDLEGRIITLVENKELRQKMGKNGRLLIKNELNWNIIAQRILNE